MNPKILDKGDRYLGNELQLTSNKKLTIVLVRCCTNIILINIRASEYVRAMTLRMIELADITEI